MQKKQRVPQTIDEALYPPIEPFKSGLLNVGDGHEIFYEQCGNPEGKPVLFLHGGPGAGCAPKSRRFFDPKHYMIVCFDQRGCNRSKPSADKDLDAALKCNNTQTLVEDCNRLKEACGVKGPWHVVLGGSWGSTLALAYAETYPSDVKSMVLRGVFTGSEDDIDYLFNNGGMLQFHPEAWERYIQHLRDSAPNAAALEEDLRHPLAAYYRRLKSGDDTKAKNAALEFSIYELSIIKNVTPQEFIDEFCNNPALLIPFATFEVHFMLNHVFLRSGELLDGIAKLAKDTKVRVCHGRCDFCTRPIAAHRMAQRMRLEGLQDVIVNFVPGTGHHDSEVPVAAAMVAATDELRCLGQ